MIEIKVNDEIRDVEAQMWLGLTLRQILLIAGGIVFGILVGVFLYSYTPVNENIIAYISIFTVSPFVVMAFLKWHDMSIVFFLKTFFTRLIEPSYKSFEEPNEEYLALIQAKEVKNTKREKKKDESKEQE